jgi:hypothetical protein
VSYNASGWGILKQGDVIMAVDGVKIANDGTVPFKGSSRIDMSYIVKSKRAGYEAVLYVLREGKALKIPIVLKKEIPVIPGQLYDVKPTYYIFGGVVFIPLTGNYLEQMWGDWSEKKQPANLMTHILGDYATKERQEIVLVRQVLADESNIGYEYFRDLVVTKISGISVAGIKDLIDKIENTKDKYLEIELENESRIVLDVEKSKKASEGILIRYQVQYDRSADLRVLQSGGV